MIDGLYGVVISYIIYFIYLCSIDDSFIHLYPLDILVICPGRRNSRLLEGYSRSPKGMHLDRFYLQVPLGILEEKIWTIFSGDLKFWGIINTKVDWHVI